MRDYSKAAPTFWTGESGRKIRAAGRDAQVVAFYLFTCPGSNWIGLYYIPLPTLCHEIGISKEGALKALRSLEAIDYSYYDLENEIVWVPGSAKFQIGESLKADDNRIKGIIKDLQQYVKSPFCADFYKRYAALYHLPEINNPTSPDKPLVSPLQAPPKPVTETVIGAVTVIGAELLARSDKKQSLQAPASPVFIQFPLNNGDLYPICQCQVEEWTGLYPAVNVEQELRNYLGWCKANPAKLKTKTGILKSVNHWLVDKQNNGGRGRKGESPLPFSKPDVHQKNLETFRGFVEKKSNEGTG
jgi:hypothetical protein